MQQPSTQVDTEFVQFLQGLPADWETRMRELGAFTYAGNIPSPPALLRAIFLYCGPDQALREVAGTLTLRAERITAQAVWKRLHRCTPFLITLLKQMGRSKSCLPCPSTSGSFHAMGLRESAQVPQAPLTVST